MTTIRFYRLFLLALAGSVLLMFSCRSPVVSEGAVASTPAAHAAAPDTVSAHPPAERKVRRIPLIGPLSKPNAEISGIAWHKDKLVLLPQYPFRMSGSADHGLLFTLTYQEIEAFLSGRRREPLTPRPVTLLAPALEKRVPAYQGCEALAFRGSQAFVAVESVADAATGAMHGFVFTGRLAGDTLRLNMRRPARLPPQTTIGNMAYEALLTLPGRVVALYEANGRNVNPNPKALVFMSRLRPRHALPFPALEYRLTDATALDDDRHFWVMNYFFPGERDKLDPAPDPLSQTQGTASLHTTPVERLVEFRLSDTGIQRTPASALHLSLLPDTPRNWEGAARFQSDAHGPGFLLITDQYPTTLLGFVPAAEDDS